MEMRCCFLVSLSVDWLQAEEPEDDDVDLANYMDLEDDMECKSAASWNPKFQFEAGSDSPNISKLGKIPAYAIPTGL